MKRSVSSAGAMQDFAAEFVAALAHGASAATVIALSGELGAGKTTFTQAAAKALGVEETVNSPTFVIEKIYQLPLDSARGENKFSRLIHIDAYRLKSAEELTHLGWDDIIVDPLNLIIIEWPEHVEEAIPKNAHRIRIEILSTSLDEARDKSLGASGEERVVTYGN